MNKKIIFGILVLIVLGTVLYLTFQSPEDTTFLSHTLKSWLEKFGLEINELKLRSHIHFVEYFVVGIVLSVFGKVMGWNRFAAPILGCTFGLIDETIKIFLPTREFSAVDFLKDCCGVWAAAVLVWIISGLLLADR